MMNDSIAEFLTAFSSDTKTASLNSIYEYTHSVGAWNINFDTLEASMDPILLRDMGAMIDVGAEIHLQADSDGEAVDNLFAKMLPEISSDIFEDNILITVTLISLIRKDLPFSDNKNINEKLLKELFQNNSLDHLLHIRYSLYVKRLKYLEELEKGERSCTN